MATKKPKVKKVSRASLMRQYYNGNPTATTTEVAKKFKTTYQVAYMVRREMQKIKLSKAPKAPKVPKVQTLTPDFPITMEEPKADLVNHPAHYKVGGIETIDFIEAKALGYHLGNAVKYITRADHKGNRLQDLQKAKWYIDRAIEKAGA